MIQRVCLFSRYDSMNIYTYMFISIVVRVWLRRILKRWL